MPPCPNPMQFQHKLRWSLGDSPTTLIMKVHTAEEPTASERYVEGASGEKGTLRFRGRIKRVSGCVWRNFKIIIIFQSSATPIHGHSCHLPSSSSPRATRKC